MNILVVLGKPQHPRPSTHKSRHVSNAVVRVKYPGRAHVSVYLSRDKAVADLYEQSSQLSEYATWDPATRMIEVYPKDEKVLPSLSGEGKGAKNYIWLPNR